MNPETCRCGHRQSSHTPLDYLGRAQPLPPGARQGLLHLHWVGPARPASAPAVPDRCRGA